MGNLVSTTPFSEITATLELLESFGVEKEDLKFFRKYCFGGNFRSKSFAFHVAQVIKSGRTLLAQAVGRPEENALDAVDKIDDPDILYDVAMNVEALVSVRIAALSKLPQAKLYDVARMSGAPKVAHEAMLRLDVGWLHSLASCDYISSRMDRNFLCARFNELEAKRQREMR